MLTTTDFSIKHSIPGRLRVIFPALISHKNLTRCLETYLSGTPGIDSVQSSHFCGSLTISYSPQVSDKQHILDLLRDIPWNDIAPPEFRISRVKAQNSVRPLAPKERKKKGFRTLWNVAGGLSIGVGIVGVFVPLLPTVPLFLLSGFCFWRGSPKFYNRLINFGPVGQLVDNFRKGNGLPAKMKSRAIVFMWISMATSMIFFVNSNTLRAIMVLVGIGVTLYILRIKTADPLIITPKRQGIPAKAD